MSTSLPAPGIDLRTPWMNAAGSLGFAPDPHNSGPFEHYGAFVTNPISVSPRRASQAVRLLEFPGGVLLHTGHPNPGLRSVVKEYAAAWAHAPLPIIVHLLATKRDELRKAVLRIEDLENILAIELGFESDIETKDLGQLLRAAQGELPLITQLPLLRASQLMQMAAEAGIAAISLAPPRGALPAADGKLVNGRLYGPAIFPLALDTVRKLAALEIPIIGAGGIQTRSQGEAMLAAGASAVQVDVSLWSASLTAD